MGLQGVVVGPTFAHPRRGVDVRVIVVLRTVNVASRQIAFLVAVSSRQASSRLCPQLRPPGNFIRFLGRRVRVAASPIHLIDGTSTVANGAYIVKGVSSLGEVEVRVIVRISDIRVVTERGVHRSLASVFAALKGYQIRMRLISVDGGPFQVLVVCVFQHRLILRKNFRPVEVGPNVGLRVPFPTFLGRGLRQIPREQERLSLYPYRGATPQFVLQDVRHVHFKARLGSGHVGAHPLGQIRLTGRYLFRSFYKGATGLSISDLCPYDAGLAFKVFITHQRLYPRSRDRGGDRGWGVIFRLRGVLGSWWYSTGVVRAPSGFTGFTSCRGAEDVLYRGVAVFQSGTRRWAAWGASV